MILAVDIGNTNIVIGAYRDSDSLFFARVKTDIKKTQWEYAMVISDLLKLNGLLISEITGFALSSVVPGLTAVLCKSVNILGINKTMTVGPGLKTGLNIRIDDPAELGADLVCTAVATIDKYPLPAIIIDLGTATKIYVVDKNKNFLGGAIMPGALVALSALSASAAQLPNIGLEHANIKAIGKNTISCMTSGTILGTASMLDGMIERCCAEIGDVSTIVACGGLVQAIIPHCKHEIIIDEGLLIDGLMSIYHKNM